MNIKETIKTINNFPKEGVKFLDVTTILEDPATFKYTVDWLSNIIKTNEIKTVVGVDARGFIWASAAAYATGTPLVLARKAGKFPGSTVEMEYKTEYSTARIALKMCQKIEAPVLVVDDIIATGGTLEAVGELLSDLWKISPHNQIHAALVDLSFIGGKEKLSNIGYRTLALATY
jgi:adenine phosphoribosyltransferase